MSESGKNRLRLPCPPEITLASAVHCCRSPSLPTWRAPGASLEWLFQRIAQTAAELTFQRWLAEENAPHRLQASAPFSQPGERQVSLGGRLCEFHLRRIPARHVAASPTLLDTPYTLPWESAFSPYHQDEGLLLFADFLAAPPVIEPAYRAFLFPPGWMRSAPWRSLGSLRIELRGELPFSCELSGLDQAGRAQSESLHARPRQPISPTGEYYTLACLHGDAPPPTYLRLYSPGLRRACLARPARWVNLYRPAEAILFAGYITRRELRQRAEVIGPTELRLPPRELHTLASLLPRLRAWGSEEVR
ncbi:MAG: hypothetical protein L0Z70_05800 [Chloroflexi bacterium]|nr:hypothetical protein [Chloroflexota bacterium]